MPRFVSVCLIELIIKKKNKKQIRILLTVIQGVLISIYITITRVKFIEIRKKVTLPLLFYCSWKGEIRCTVDVPKFCHLNLSIFLIFNYEMMYSTFTNKKFKVQFLPTCIIKGITIFQILFKKIEIVEPFDKQKLIKF